VESLRRTRFEGDIRLFVGGVTRDTVEALKRSGIEVSPFPRVRLPWPGGGLHPYDVRLWRLQRIYPALVRTLTLPSGDRTAAAARVAAPISVPVVGRFFRYCHYLSTARPKYRHVMLTDVRDVFFQHDPFDFDIGDELVCFLEDERQTLGGEPHNSTWLRTAFGESVLEELGGCPISCVGTTIGSTRQVLSYVRTMTDWLVGFPHQYFGLDQAVHNYVLHKGLVSAARQVRNDAGVVLTLGIVPTDSLEPPIRGHVLHQYDRHPRLAEQLRRTIEE
jgi:hypothetical protein